MRTLSIALLLPALLAADVVVLKEGGEKVVGRVADKGGHWEVTTDQGLRTFLKDEVERVISSPDEFVADAPALYESAKADFQKITAPDAPMKQNEAVKEAVAKLAKAREMYAGARELFPEDKYAILDTKLVQVMQLTRMLRDRLGSEIAKGPAAPVVTPRPTVAAPPPAALPPLEAAFGVLVDAAKRAVPADRKAARDAFLAHRGSSPGLYDLATASALYLSKPEPAGAAMQEYFSKPWFKEPLKLTPAQHLEAATWLSGKKDVDVLFILGHLSQAPKGPEAEKAAKALNLVVQGGVPGTLEGHAVRDMAGWVRSGDYELAHRAYVGEHRSTSDTSAVRFVWSFAVLELAVVKKKGYEKVVSAFSGLKATEAAVDAHAGALVKSLKAVTPCGTCSGDGWLRCTNCHGQKVIYVICKVCNGTRIKGNGFFCNPCKFTGIAAKLVCNKCKDGYFDCPKCKLPDCKTCAGAGRTMCKTCDGLRLIKKTCGTCNGSGLNRGYAPPAGGGAPKPEDVFCQNCKGSGTEKITRCAACTNGFIDCTACEPLRKPPVVEDVCAVSECALCEGRGTPFKGAAYTCRSCLGLGLKLSPKLDPAKVLPD
jgi:hypothetical protein